MQLRRLQNKCLLLTSDIEIVLKSLPRDINALYNKMLQEDIHEDHRHLALRVLRWLAVSYRPLEHTDIYEICTIPTESDLGSATMLERKRHVTIDQLLVLLPDLVRMNYIPEGTYHEPSGEGILTFSHFSVREYLMGSQILDPPFAHSSIRLRYVHRLVAKDCLAYLYLLQVMGSNGALERYAYAHWPLHAVTTGELDEETRRNAFFLSASIFADGLATLDTEIPKDLLTVSTWFEEPERNRKLISALRKSPYALDEETRRQAAIFSASLSVFADLWCGEPKRNRELTSIRKDLSFSIESKSEGEKVRLAMLYPQDPQDKQHSTVTRRVHHVPHTYAPS